MPSGPNKLSRFWQELRRRQVIHTIIFYATAAFVIIELANNVSEPLNLPDWTPRLVIIILAIGFPIAILLSWIFDISFKGIKKTDPLDYETSKKQGESGEEKFSRFEKSIAVLPFQDMSPNKDQEYFCDGISEEIINTLTHIESLKVIARTSAFAFKNTHTDMREIGQKLNVETLLEGSIRKDGNRIRITAQLIKVADGFHLWSESYNRDLEDVFAIQEEISLAIAEQLKIRLLGKEKAEISHRYPEDPESHNLLLLGIHLQNKGSEEGMKKAIEYYEKVIELAPDSARAYTGLATCYTMLGFWDYLAPTIAFPKAKEAALNAILYDAKLSEAHASLGLVKTFYDWDWEGAERSNKKALDLSPNYAQAHMGRAFLNVSLGRIEDGISAARKAVELDPLSAFHREVLGIALIRAGHISQAREQFSRALELVPDFAQALWMEGHTHILEENYEEGISDIENALNLSKNNTVILSGLGWAYGMAGQNDDARRLVEGLEKRKSIGYIRSYLFAKIYAALGEKDRAFEYLDSAYEEHDPSLAFIMGDETLSMLNTDPRFKGLLKRIGLESYSTG